MRLSSDESTPVRRQTTELRVEQLNAFYELMSILTDRTGGPFEFASCRGRQWPERGVYFFFEDGEVQTGERQGMRIVRVGTHALKEGGRTFLWSRLCQHRGTVKSGGGNHRGSVFRLLVGAALAKREPTLSVPTWGKGSTANREIRALEACLEETVSRYISRMKFLVLNVPDAAGPSSLRGYIERNSIALISNYDREAIDPPSKRWLGRHCPRDRVQRSGLWNNNHVDERYDPAFIETLDRLVNVSPA